MNLDDLSSIIGDGDTRRCGNWESRKQSPFAKDDKTLAIWPETAATNNTPPIIHQNPVREAEYQGKVLRILKQRKHICPVRCVIEAFLRLGDSRLSMVST